VLRAAFGDQPLAAVSIRPSDPPEQRWLGAVVLGARGQYARAAALLEEVYGQLSATVAVRAHAAATRAAHLRQLGGHLAARRWDSRALAIASTASVGERVASRQARSAGESECGSSNDDAGLGLAGLDVVAAAVDALVGLAADAIGLGELALADRLLNRAERTAREHPSWRPLVRWHWVRAELALAQGLPEQAARVMEPAVALARRAGAARHEIKSALVRSAAEAGAGRAVRELDPILNRLAAQARRADLATLEWPIELLLSDLLSEGDITLSAEHRRRAIRILGGIWLGADPRGRKVLDRSPWVPMLSDTGLLH
jgi:hypothetical protein